ncbi:MAG: RDD family protein [Epulopiscium sp.]|nr:RDD family protein [Candidatus Epulonipiscium sp.]
MSNASVGRRLIGVFIDYIVLIIAFTMLGILMLFTSWGTIADPSIAPIFLVEMIFYPLSMVIRMIQYPRGYWMYWIPLIIFFLVEIVYYSAMEILTRKGSVGYLWTNTRICNENGDPQSIHTIIGRNCLKTFSRYLFVIPVYKWAFIIPFITIIFTKNKQAMYDLITGTVVIRG